MTSEAHPLKLEDTSDVFGQTDFAKKKDGFHWVETDEPHATRRKLIMKAHPEMKQLFTKEPRTFWLCLAILVFQTSAAAYFADKSLWYMIPFAWIVGGALNHTLQLAAHELSHNLCWDGLLANQLTAIMANLPTGVPSAITFARYHKDHHQYQGVQGMDTDVPTQFEVYMFGNDTCKKLLWVFMQPLWYALRPLYIKPKTPIVMEAVNFAVAVGWDYLIVTFLGWQALGYMIASTLLGLGLHPAAGHFIAEHYEFVMGYETYSYYGIINYLNFNVGYHNEHHDFPRIPWSNLPKVREIAPEFYDNLPYHTSYVAVIWRYITDPEIGPFSRIQRKDKRAEKKAS